MAEIDETKRKKSFIIQTLILIFVFGALFVFLLGPSLSLSGRNEHAYEKVTVFNLKNAISAYYTEYRKYPLEIAKFDITMMSGNPLMSVLTGTNDPAPLEYNPRRIDFYSGKPARFRNGRYLRGLQNSENGPCYLWDTWGNHFQIRLDTDYDQKIENPELPGEQLPETIAIWSAGPDGNFSTWKDNIKSW